MALSIVEMEEMLDALIRARSSGVLIVRHQDTQTTYRSVEELEAAIASLKSDIRKRQGKSRKVRTVTQTGKGY